MIQMSEKLLPFFEFSRKTARKFENFFTFIGFSESTLKIAAKLIKVVYFVAIF